VFIVSHTKRTHESGRLACECYAHKAAEAATTASALYRINAPQ
jgi:hypothetical protein